MNNPKFPKEEPSAEVRQTAYSVRQIFVALVHEGFTEEQALALMGQVLLGKRED